MRVLPILLAAALTLPGLARSQGAEVAEALWYQVEIMVFRYLETEDESEAWPALPDLSYPAQMRHLRAGADEAGLQDNMSLQRVEDSVPAPAFDLAWDKTIDELKREYAASRDPLAYGSPLPVLEAAPGEPDQGNGEAGDIDVQDLTVPRAFSPLDSEAREFDSEALRIRRSRDMRLLYHQSWLQPLRPRDQSLPVALDSVISHGDYPALQGSILLYVSRYLHVETRLWLNLADADAPGVDTPDGAAGDEDLVAWSMPAPPLPRQPYQWRPWEFRVDLTSDPADVLQPVVIRARRLGEFDVDAFLGETWYPFDHAVLVQQKRRMRGGELHYLDHPLLGVILRVSPYEFEPFSEEDGLSEDLAARPRSTRR